MCFERADVYFYAIHRWVDCKKIIQNANHFHLKQPKAGDDQKKAVVMYKGRELLY